jgi:light-regulated signal transduction histidine kinase (bacteriophytochrome)
MITTDITPLRAYQQQLETKNAALSRSNEYLQQFAYVASHDLQEPLRKIKSFGDLLKSQYEAQLGEGAIHLGRMQAAADRMSRLIKDLLNFSRISTQQEVFQSVSLTEVVTTVLSDLDLRIEEVNAVIEVGPLPSLQGDRLQLEQLFLNLLSNSLKFRQANVPPEIRVSSQKVAAISLPPSVKPTRPAAIYHRIDVTDNGIGFEAKYVDRIFQVFQRLHNRKDFAGTGVGLAICEKVVDHHGGAITAVSQPGEGATFSVYLPV